MRTFATLTKQTAKGLSTWSFVECDGILIGFGGTTNRCRTFRTHQQMQQCILNFVGYGYQLSTKSAPAPVAKPRKFEKPVKQAAVKTLEQLEAFAASQAAANSEQTDQVVQLA